MNNSKMSIFGTCSLGALSIYQKVEPMGYNGHG